MQLLDYLEETAALDRFLLSLDLQLLMLVAVAVGRKMEVLLEPAVPEAEVRDQIKLT